MGKQEVEDLERKKMDAKKSPAQNGVIISVYVESPTLRSSQMDPAKKSKPKSISISKKPKTTRTRGYDRRAQLLTYARELRNSDSQEVQWPRKNLRPKPKLLERTSSRWKYERIPLEENTEEVDGKKKKNTTTKRGNSPLLRKLRCILDELSCKGCHRMVIKVAEKPAV